MVRAIIGSILGATLTMFLFLEGPQVFQQGIALISDAGVPETLVAGGAMAYVGGFVGNPQRPRGWIAVAIWAGGWIAGFLVIWLLAYLTRPIPA